MTASAAAAAARKKITPSHGFQYGCAAISGCQATVPRMTPLAARPPNAPSADHAASIASEQATMHHSAAPHTAPSRGSRWTGIASSQYCSGPGSNAPLRSWVACPTRGP